MARIHDEPDLTDVARPADERHNGHRADDLAVLDCDPAPGAGLHPVLEDLRVPHVLLQECPIALGNLLKEADERRAIAGLDWSNLHAAPRSGRVAVIDAPAGQLRQGVLERRPAGAKRDVTARQPKLLAARWIADKRHHR